MFPLPDGQFARPILFEELCAESLWDGGPCIGSRALWDVLSTQPGLGIAIVDASGRVTYANDEAVRVCLCAPSENAVGSLINDLFPSAVADEIYESIQRVINSDVLVIRRTVWGGKPLQTTFRALPQIEGEETLVLVTTTIGSAESTRPNTEVAETNHVELGKLNVLTPRELEVLALMGEGRRIKDIAEILSRSPKTIESHKEGIGRKLKITDRAKFIEIARDAGIQPETAFRQRVRLEPKETDPR